MSSKGKEEEVKKGGLTPSHNLRGLTAETRERRGNAGRQKGNESLNPRGRKWARGGST